MGRHSRGAQIKFCLSVSLSLSTSPAFSKLNVQLETNRHPGAIAIQLTVLVCVWPPPKLDNSLPLSLSLALTCVSFVHLLLAANAHSSRTPDANPPFATNSQRLARLDFSLTRRDFPHGPGRSTSSCCPTALVVPCRINKHQPSSITYSCMPKGAFTGDVQLTRAISFLSDINLALPPL